MKAFYLRLISVFLALILVFSLSSCVLFPLFTDLPNVSTGEEIVLALKDAAASLSVEEDTPTLAAIVALLHDEDLDVGNLTQTETLYYTYYIGEFQPVHSVAKDMLRMIAKAVPTDALTDTDTLLAFLIEAYTVSLGDRYSVYFSPEDFSEYENDVNATYTGIGIQVVPSTDGLIEIISVFPDSPALTAGLREGDVIVEIEGEDVSTVGYNDAVNLVRGEAGTALSLTVLRNGERISFSVVRAVLTEYSVGYELLTGDYSTTGLIRIYEFDNGTFPQFVAAYQALKALGADRFVFDVRANPGGRLDAVCAVLEYILPDGPITHIDYKIDEWDYTVTGVFDVLSRGTAICAEYEELYRDIEVAEGSGDHVIHEPIAVIINDYTASAGELFSSAIRDYANRGEINARLFGTNSYGKGTGQSSFALKDGAYLNVSIFLYSPPYGANYEGVGVAPHTTATLSPEAAEKSVYLLTLEEDTQLLAALTHLSAAIPS